MKLAIGFGWLGSFGVVLLKYLIDAEERLNSGMILCIAFGNIGTSLIARLNLTCLISFIREEPTPYDCCLAADKFGMNALTTSGILSVCLQSLIRGDQDQDQDSLLVKRRNDNHSPGPVIRELVPSSHQRSELSNTILCIFSG